MVWFICICCLFVLGCLLAIALLLFSVFVVLVYFVWVGLRLFVCCGFGLDCVISALLFWIRLGVVWLVVLIVCAAWVCLATIPVALCFASLLFSGGCLRPMPWVCWFVVR